MFTKRDGTLCGMMWIKHPQNEKRYDMETYDRIALYVWQKKHGMTLATRNPQRRMIKGDEVYRSVIWLEVIEGEEPSRGFRFQDHMLHVEIPNFAQVILDGESEELTPQELADTMLARVRASGNYDRVLTTSCYPMHLMVSPKEQEQQQSPMNVISMFCADTDQMYADIHDFSRSRFCIECSSVQFMEGEGVIFA